MFFNCFAKYMASLYPGLFFQLTVGLTGYPSLCNLMVPCMYGASGFVFVYLHLSGCLIVFLHWFIVVL